MNYVLNFTLSGGNMRGACLRRYRLFPAHCNDFLISQSFCISAIPLMTFYPTFLSYERMHLSDVKKVNNEDTVMHDYIHDTFKETFRDSNYDVIW